MSVLEELAGRGVRGPGKARADTRILAALHVLDTMGCVAAGVSHPLAAQLSALVSHTGDRGDLRSPALTGTHSLRATVLVESVLAHADEYDALHPGSAVVPSAVVVPAALAVADLEGRPGSAVIDSVVAGYEVAVEAGLRFGGPQLYARSWWPTAVFGALGAAAATAHLLDLDREATTVSLGLAAAGLGGLLSQDELAAGHYLLAGRAAANGVEAAYLARAGARASPTLLDGPGAAALGVAAAPGSAAARPHLDSCVFKAYPCALPLHAALRALDSLAESRVPVGSAQRVEVLLPSSLSRFVSADRAPSGPTEAAASAAFAVGAWLRGAAGDVAFFRGELPPDTPEVVLGRAPDLDAGLPDHWGARVVVHLPDGQRIVREETGAARETALPALTDMVTAKFRRRVGTAGDGPGDGLSRELWITRCLALDAVDDIRDLRLALSSLAGP
ncbi:MmgE/PrpD family protein [Streptomyces sp. NPDC127033]|uniref:MmgE/PrpD family protein n=1 Tax=Streptomyces sp. NPDC127033 TaxID=3347110 RepID=UPI003668966E